MLQSTYFKYFVNFCRLDKKNMTGTQLKKWREDFGLTQKRLSHLLAVDKSTISAWEIGRRRIPPRSERALKYLIDHVEQTVRLVWPNSLTSVS